MLKHFWVQLHAQIALELELGPSLQRPSSQGEQWSKEHRIVTSLMLASPGNRPELFPN